MAKRLKTIAYCYSHAFMMWRRRLAVIYRYAREAGWLGAQLLEKRMRRPRAKPQLSVFGNSTVVVRPSLGRFAKRDAAVFRAIEFIFTRATGMSLREWRETCKNGATASTCPIS